LQHPIIAEAGAFKLTAKDYEDFVAYVKTKDHSYKTETDDKLEALKTVSTEEKYYESLKTSLDAVQQKLSQIRAQELQTQKDEIITLLENEIVGRYYYAYGKVKKSYQNDPEVAKAIELLLNPTKYNELLTVKSK
jgi:carboxyl-terminal processing protease